MFSSNTQKIADLSGTPPFSVFRPTQCRFLHIIYSTFWFSLFIFFLSTAIVTSTRAFICAESDNVMPLVIFSGQQKSGGVRALWWRNGILPVWRGPLISFPFHLELRVCRSLFRADELAFHLITVSWAIVRASMHVFVAVLIAGSGWIKDDVRHAGDLLSKSRSSLLPKSGRICVYYADC